MDTQLINSQSELIIQNKLLKSINQIAEILLKSNASVSNNSANNDFENNICKFLKILGLGLEASRATIFKITQIYEDDAIFSQLNEWCDKAFHCNLNNPLFQNISFNEIGLATWYQVLSNNETIYGDIFSNSEEKNKIFLERNPYSILILPLFVNQRLWGFISFEEYHNKRIWSNTECEILKKAADFINITIERNSLINTNPNSLKQDMQAINPTINKMENISLAKSEFLNKLSHEIRTPLNSILGYSDVLLEYFTNNEEIIEYINLIHSAGNSLLRLTNNLADLFKIEFSKITLNLKPTDLTSTFKEIGTIFSEKINLKKLNYITEFDNFIPTNLFIDETKLRQVLINIIGNAVKYTQNGFIKATCQLNNIIPANYTDNDHVNLLIIIEDTGIGIEEKYHEVIFEPLSRHIIKSNSAYEGSGLSLAISQKLIKSMNGNIQVKSELGNGSKFFIYLNNVKVLANQPISKLNIANRNDLKEINILNSHNENFNLELTNLSTKQEIFTKKNNSSQKLILIIDDNINNLKLLTSIINNMGFTPAFTQNGAEALEYLKNNTPDLILLDILLPELNGYEIFKIIKSDPKNVSIPVIFITAKNDKESEIAALNLGGADYISKPLNSSIIKARIINQIDLIESKEILHKKIQELTEANAEKDKFLNILVHDLRNPFFGVIGLLELLIHRKKSFDKEKIYEYIERINTLSVNIYNLFEKLLEWGNLRRGLYKIQYEDIEITERLGEIIKFYSDLAHIKNITINFKPQDKVEIKFDNNIFRLIFMNLLNNAIKFTYPHGNIYIEHWDSKSDIVISIKDTGVGMDEQQLKNLFSLSKSITTPGTNGEKGTGLGLLMIRELEKLNELELSVFSEPEKGTEFRVKFNKKTHK